MSSEETNDPWRPLDGLRVLDISRTSAGAYAGKLFREYGADVVLLEDPDAESEVRRAGPHSAAGPGVEFGGLHRYLNAGKRGIALRDSTPDGREVASGLAACADLVIHEYVKVEADVRGLTFEKLSVTRESAVVLGITPFGEDGPYASWSATEEILFALSGRMALQGEPERHPLAYAPLIVASQIAATAAGVAMAALNESDVTGRGCGIDVSGLEAQLSSVDNLFLMWSMSKWEPPRGLYPPYTYPCADGAILLGALRGKYLEGMAIAAGHPEIPADPRFNSPTALADHIVEFDDLMLPFFLQHGTVELVSILQAHGVLCAPLQSARAALSDPQYSTREFFRPVDTAFPGLAPGPMFRIEAETPPPTPDPAPRGGQHTAEVLREWLALEDLAIHGLAELGAIA